MRKNKKSIAILLSLFLFGIGNTSFGQFQQDTWMIGANGSISGGKNSFNLVAEGKLSYFIRPKLELGLSYSYAQSRYNLTNMNVKERRIGIEHFARYYFLKPESKLNIFAHAGIQTSLRYSNILFNPTFNLETNIGGGVTYFLTPRLSLEARFTFQPGYTPYPPLVRSPITSTIGLNFRLGK